MPTTRPTVAQHENSPTNTWIIERCFRRCWTCARPSTRQSGCLKHDNEVRMSNTHKGIVGGALVLCGLALIGWNLRDPERAYHEQPKEKHPVTMEQLPLPVQSAIKLASSGGKIEKLLEQHQGGTTTYESDVVVGDTKTELKLGEDGSVIKRKSKKLKPTA